MHLKMGPMFPLRLQKKHTSAAANPVLGEWLSFHQDLSYKFDVHSFRLFFTKYVSGCKLLICG